MEKRAKPLQIRPTQPAREWLEQKQNAGLEMTEIINGLILKYGDKFVEEMVKEKIQKLQKAIA